MSAGGLIRKKVFGKKKKVNRPPLHKLAIRNSIVSAKVEAIGGKKSNSKKYKVRPL